MAVTAEQNTRIEQRSYVSFSTHVHFSRPRPTISAASSGDKAGFSRLKISSNSAYRSKADAGTTMRAPILTPGRYPCLIQFTMVCRLTPRRRATSPVVKYGGESRLLARGYRSPAHRPGVLRVVNSAPARVLSPKCLQELLSWPITSEPDYITKAQKNAKSANCDRERRQQRTRDGASQSCLSFSTPFLHL